MNQPISIVIADDHLLIAETWATLINLEPALHVLKVFSNTSQLLEEISTLQPDIVLLDINIPPISGLQALPFLKEKSPKTQVIGVSMHTQPTFAKRMIENGAKGYVTKNSGKDEMYHAIYEVMKGNTYICKEIRNNHTLEVLEGGDISAKLNELSARELGIIKLIKQGYTTEEISKQLFLSPKTIGSHRTKILKKLGLKNSLSLIRLINEYFPDI